MQVDERPTSADTRNARDAFRLRQLGAFVEVSWTPDRKDTLRRMWIEGRSSREIAEALGDVTRNAVMGMVNRMGLMGNEAHNALIRPTSGACKPAGVARDASAAPAEMQNEPPRKEPDAAPPPVETPSKRPRLASRLFEPIRRAIEGKKGLGKDGVVDAKAPAAARDSSIRPNPRTARALVEEIMGQRYDPAAKGHRTSLVAIAAILGGGDARPYLPRDVPDPFVTSTMRSMSEKGIMVAGRTPESWLHPELGDINFMIDMMIVEGVVDAGRTSSSAT